MKNIYDATLNGNIVIDENVVVGSPMSKLTVTFDTSLDYTNYPFDTFNKDGGYEVLIRPESSGIPGLYTYYYIDENGKERYQIRTFMNYGGPTYPIDTIYDSEYGWYFDKYSWEESTTSNIDKIIDNYQKYFTLSYETISLKETVIETSQIAKSNQKSIDNLNGRTFPFASSKLVQNHGNPVFFDELKNYLLELKDNPRYYNNTNQFHKFTLNRQGMNYDAIIYTGTNEEDNIGMVDYLLIIANGDIFKAYPIKDESDNVIDFEIKPLVPSTEELVQLVIEALPKYNGEVIE